MSAQPAKPRPHRRKAETRSIQITAKHDANIDHAVLHAGDQYGNNTIIDTVPETEEIQALFSPLQNAIQAACKGDPVKEKEATEKALALKAEMTKKKPDDGVVATLIKGLVDLVPSAVTAIGTMFGQPILAALAGPVTKIVLDTLKLKAA